MEFSANKFRLMNFECLMEFSPNKSMCVQMLWMSIPPLFFVFQVQVFQTAFAALKLPLAGLSDVINRRIKS